MNQGKVGTETEQQYIIWLEPDREPAASLIGNKALGILKLMKLTHLGFKIPKGFVITTNAYNEIWRLEAENIDTLARGRTRGLGRTAKMIQEHLYNAFEQERLLDRLVPYDVILNLVAPPYKRFCDFFGVENLGVVVRSSAVYEDLRTRSYAGSYESYLNVKGTKSLVKKILHCFVYAWKKHLFKDRAKNKIPMEAGIALLVQRIICSDVAGVTFTADQVSGDPSKICINSAWGLGDAVVSGRLNADIFYFDKRTMQLEQTRIAEKNLASRCQSAGGTYLESVPPELIYTPSLTPENALRVAWVCLKVENELGFPVDIEWAFSKNDLYLLQVRPITTL